MTISLENHFLLAVFFLSGKNHHHENTKVRKHENEKKIQCFPEFVLS